MTGSPPVHAPAWQVSVCVQRLSSLHGVPSGLGAFTHRPVEGSQTAASWHASPGVEQVIAWPPSQTPAWQASSKVQKLPSLHDEPSGFAGFEHMPVDGSQTPAWWHASDALHTTAGPPTHAPARPL